jgi:hypothetical protein
MASFICRDILANNWNERCGFLDLAKVGNLLFKRSSPQESSAKVIEGNPGWRIRTSASMAWVAHGEEMNCKEAFVCNRRVGRTHAVPPGFR